MQSIKQLLSKPSKTVLVIGVVVLFVLGVLLSYRIFTEDPLCAELRSEISRQERVRNFESQRGSLLSDGQKLMRAADDLERISNLYFLIKKRGIKCIGD